MKVNGVVRFLGSEKKTSKKGNDYHVVLMQQGVETLNCMSDIEINLEYGQEFVATFEFNPQYKTVKLISSNPN